MTSRPLRIAFSLALCSLAIAAAGCRGARLHGAGSPGPAGPAVPNIAAAAAPKPAVAASPKPAPAPVAKSVAAVPSSPQRSPRVGGFDAENVPLEQALAEARRQGRPCAIFFTTTWCGWCRRLERDTLPDASVRAELANWYVVKYDADRGAGRSAAAHYGVDGFPTFTFVDSAGRGAGEAAGYSDPARFVAKLRAARH
jgi:thiol:disulfide interchange protein